MRLALTEVRIDPDLQLRGGLDMDRVKAMNEFEEQGGHLPPIIVVGDDNLLADGHHRLEAAERIGRIDIEAERVVGSLLEAIAIAIRHNDIATSLPLTRTQRNQGIKLLLKAGWTQARIGKAAGVSQHTVSNIANAAELKDKLPAAVSEKIGDTVALRIAEMVPADQQEEFATAVAAVPNKKDPSRSGLMESRVREAAKAVKAGEYPTATAAVVDHTPVERILARTMPEIAKQARRRLEHFLAEPMTVDGTEYDFWQVLEVLATRVESIPLEAKSLSRLLTDVADKAYDYSARLREELAVVTA